MTCTQPTFTEQLQSAIVRSHLSRYRISLETGIPQGQLSRFVYGKGGLSIRSIDRLCACLALVLEQTEPELQKEA